MITEQHVDFDTAKLLAEAGFNEPCKTVYTDARGWDGKGDIFEEKRYQVPTQSIAARWLREKHRIHVAVTPSNKAWYWELRKTNGAFIAGSAQHNPTSPDYEQALEAGLKEALEIIINQAANPAACPTKPNSGHPRSGTSGETTHQGRPIAGHPRSDGLSSTGAGSQQTAEASLQQWLGNVSDGIAALAAYAPIEIETPEWLHLPTRLRPHPSAHADNPGPMGHSAEEAIPGYSHEEMKDYADGTWMTFRIRIPRTMRDQTTRPTSPQQSDGGSIHGQTGTSTDTNNPPCS